MDTERAHGLIVVLGPPNDKSAVSPYMGVPHAGDAGVRVELARHEAEALRREKAKME